MGRSASENGLAQQRDDRVYAVYEWYKELAKEQYAAEEAIEFSDSHSLEAAQ